MVYKIMHKYHCATKTGSELDHLLQKGNRLCSTIHDVPGFKLVLIVITDSFTASSLLPL